MIDDSAGPVLAGPASRLSSGADRSLTARSRIACRAPLRCFRPARAGSCGAGIRRGSDLMYIGIGTIVLIILIVLLVLFLRRA